MTQEMKFKIAFEMLIEEFFANAEKAGMSYEEAKEWLENNKEQFVQRIKMIIE